MIATILQILGLVGLPVGGTFAAGWPGGLIGGSMSLVYIGLAMERD